LWRHVVGGPAPARKHPEARLLVEGLEDRTMPSGSALQSCFTPCKPPSYGNTSHTGSSCFKKLITHKKCQTKVVHKKCHKVVHKSGYHSTPSWSSGKGAGSVFFVKGSITVNVYYVSQSISQTLNNYGGAGGSANGGNGGNGGNATGGNTTG